MSIPRNSRAGTPGAPPVRLGAGLGARAPAREAQLSAVPRQQEQEEKKHSHSSRLTDPATSSSFFLVVAAAGGGVGGSGGTSGEDDKERSEDDDFHKPGRHKEKGAAPPLDPTESPAGQACDEDGRGSAGRAAGDSGVAGPRTGAQRLPAHPGPRLHRAAPPASRAPRPHHRRAARRTHAETPRSGRRAPPAPPDPRPSGVEALARLPFGVLRLLLIVPVYPARVLVVQLQALLAGRRLAVLRHRGGASCGSDAWGRERGGRSGGASSSLYCRPPSPQSPRPRRPPRPAQPGPAHRAGGRGQGSAHRSSPEGGGAERASVRGGWSGVAVVVSPRLGAGREPWNPKPARASARGLSLNAARSLQTPNPASLHFWITGHAILTSLHVSERV